MSPVKKYIGIALLIVVVGGAIYAYKEYNRKPADLTEKEADMKIEAVALIAAYEKDEVLADQQYLGKTLQVSGNIAAFDNQQDTLINVLLGDTMAMSKVSCLLDQQHMEQIKKYTIGQPITIRGICTGYLMDVELNRCIIVE